jgi:hypothetical protein
MERLVRMEAAMLIEVSYMYVQSSGSLMPSVYLSNMRLLPRLGVLAAVTVSGRIVAVRMRLYRMRLL